MEKEADYVAIDRLADEVKASLVRLLRGIAAMEIKHQSRLSVLDILRSALDRRQQSSPATIGRQHFQLLGLTRYMSKNVREQISRVRKEKGIDAAIDLAKAERAKKNGSKRQRAA